MPGTTGRSGDCRQEKAPVRPGLFFSHAALQTTDAVIVREIIHVLGVLVMCDGVFPHGRVLSAGDRQRAGRRGAGLCAPSAPLS
jgi:hypothetical protein